MFSPAPKTRTEEKEIKVEEGVEEDDDSVEPDEKKPKMDDDKENKTTKDSEET